MFTLNKYLEARAEEITGSGPSYSDEQWTIVIDTYKDWYNRLYELCERKDVDLRYSDEIIFDEQGRAHEINPGYHGQVKTWTLINECEVLAEDEVDDCFDEYVEWLEDNSNSADQWSTDFTPAGYVKHDGQYESGFHPGQTDNPETIQRELLKTFDHVIWSIDNTGQFDIGFSAWVKKD